MNELTKAYCDGAAMAYRDVAQKLHDMAANAPAETRHLMEAMLPLADSCQEKSRRVYEEAKQYFCGTRQ